VIKPAPFPPFTHDAASQKVRMAEDGWNSRDPARVSLCLYGRSVHGEIEVSFYREDQR
jgi:nuclear transport factor 2 (NTF2) superfamily protein